MFTSNAVYAAPPLMPLSLGQMYSLASQGQVRALRGAVQRGLNIDVMDRNGNTGLCHSIWKRNYTAYNAFQASGANPRHPCIQKIPTDRYDSFMSSWRVSDVKATSREAYNYFNEGEFIFSDRALWLGGLLLLGGAAALAFGGGGGGGSNYYYRDVFTPTDDSLGGFVGTASPNIAGYVPIKYDAQADETIINKDNFALSNNVSVSIKNPETGVDEQKQLVDVINFSDSVLENTKYMQVGMKASNGGFVQNGETAGSGTEITLGDATAGMVALHNGQSLNNGMLRINAQNGTVGMISSDKSVSQNNGNINMTFTGNTNTSQIMGMYADSSAIAINNGTIDGDSVAENGGTIVGMQAQIINQEATPNPVEPTNLVNSDSGDIILKATANNGVTVSKSLVGMGTYLEQDFLDGEKLIRRAGYVDMTNSGDIDISFNINGTGAYGTDSGTLMDGTGGFIGMRADANTTAKNAGNIKVAVNSVNAGSVTNAHAAMVSVHGGSIQNTKDSTIEVTGGTGGYGMLAVRGEGKNPEIDARKPTLTNSADASITVDSLNGFGMATYHGGTMSNAGDIHLQSVGTGMHINAGTATNSGNIQLDNSGEGMVIKRNNGSVDGATYNASTAKITNTADGTITIDKAANAKGMYIEAGTAQNDGTININNDQNTPTDPSYGIQALDGTVINTGSINMDVKTPNDVDSYGIHTTNAKATNEANGTITFEMRGVGMHTGSGSNTNNGKIIMNDGGTGMSSETGTIYNNLNASIELKDSGTGISSTSGQVNNLGTVTVAGENSTGINAGRSVDNSGAINMSGGGIVGIEIGDSGSVINNTNGTITLTATSNSLENYGIKGTSGVNTRVNNLGNISLTGRGYPSSVEQGYGISITEGEAYNRGDITFDDMYGFGMNTTEGLLRNYASIELNLGGAGIKGTSGKLFNESTGTITVKGTPTGQNSYGMQVEDGTAWNDGIIDVTGNGQENTDADINNSSYGIYVNGGAGVNNSVINMNSNNSYGIYDASSGEIRNQSGAVINLSGDGSYGMTTTGGTSENIGVINVGIKNTDDTVTGGNNSIGMTTNGSGTATNTGTININGNNSIGMFADGGTVINELVGKIIINGSNGTAFKTKGDGKAINRGTIEHTGSDYTLFDTTEGGTSENYGTVIISGNGNKLMEAEDGASIVNTGGTLEIDGDNSYAMYTNGSGTAENTGTINVNSTNSHGMYAKDNGSLTNSAPKGIINVVGNGSSAMTAAAADASLTNTGVINIRGLQANGLNIINGGGSTTATNSGTINLYASNSASINGAAMAAVNGTLVNDTTGQINITGTGDGMKGIATTEYGSSLENKGSIVVSGSGDGMKALINSGIASDAIVNTITNSGTVTSTNGGNGINAQRANITNSAGATISLAKGGTAINATDSTGSNTVTNDGVITITGTDDAAAVGIQTDSSGYTVTNSQSGTITIAGTNATGVIAGGGSVDNSGNIAVDAQSGKGIVTLSSASATNTGKIYVNGVNATGVDAQGSSSASNKGTITVSGNNAKGMSASASVTNNADEGLNGKESSSKILVSGEGSIGMYTYSASAKGTNYGNIEVTGKNASGMLAQFGTVTNDVNEIPIYDDKGNQTGTESYVAYINVNGDNAIGMTAGNGSAINKAIIDVNNGIGMKVTGSGTTTNETNATLDVIGNNATGMLAAGTGTAINNSTINVQGANATGMASSSGKASNTGTIDVVGATASGMSSSGSGNVENSGEINLSNASGQAGMLVNGGNANNAAGANINITGGTNQVGIKVINGTASNAGSITFSNGATGTAMTAAGTNSVATNTSSGQIIIDQNSIVAMSSSNGAKVSNAGTITVNTQVSAITATGSGSVAENAAGGVINLSSRGLGVNISNGAKGTNSGVINLLEQSESTAMAAKDTGSSIENIGTINVDSYGTGMSATSGASAINRGSIVSSGEDAMYVTGTGTAENAAYRSIRVTNGKGMTLNGTGSITNNGTINVSGTGRYGMYVTGTGSAVNKGSIVVNNTATSGSVSYGMYAINGGTITNNGTITMTGNTDNLIGMYASGAGSSIVNTGEITIASSALSNATCTPGDTSGCGKFIVVENGATFTNNATVTSAAALNLNTFAADSLSKVMLGRGGSFIAPEISGDAVAAADIVTTGEQLDEYVNEDSFIGEDTGINVSSGSYMFDASTKTNENGNIDVVMSRKAFASIVDNQEIAAYLETNYGLNNSIYNAMMSASSADSFATATAESLGLNLIPNFAKQNLDVIKSLDRQINNAVLGNDDKKPMRAMVGYDFFRRKQDGTGLLSGYKDYANSAYGIFDKAYDNNLRYGFALSFTQLDSDYDNGSERDEFITQAMAILSYNNDDFSFVSAPRLGIGFGDYERQTSDGTYKADTRNYYYGISNEARKDIDMGSFALQPVAEFNVLGLYQDNMKEKGHLEVNSANNVSVEGGLGLYAKKEYELTEDDVLKLRLGGTYYHEFNNPYQAAKARIDGLNGSYHMDSYDAQRDRGVLSARADYKHNEFNFYAEINKYLEEDDGYSINAGVGYRF
ncbi:MAG: hypothetical protein J6A33_04970 [Alphaproteobacteria bacterium]|nr:hypothetical protein [Alphaproteobacteria bacterium]